MSRNREPDSEMEELSRAITRALIKSDEVIHMLGDLKRNNRLNPNAMLAFILKTDALLSLKKNEPWRLEKEPYGMPKKQLAPKMDKGGEYIDGKRLTANERVFEKYYAERFDEDEWLKTLKLLL